MEDARVERMIAEACLGASAPEELERDLRAFLVRHGIEAEDADAICASPPRLALYRRLVRNNLTGVTWKMMPRARARLNALASGAFDASFDAFLATIGPRTHYLRDVPGEFFAWAGPRWAGDLAFPPYVADLAAHELAVFQVAALPGAPAAPAIVDPALDRALVFSESRRLMRYRFAVHELPDDPEDLTPPEARPVALLVYRDADHDVDWLEVSALGGSILDALFAKQTLRDAIASGCRAAGVVLSDAVLADTARLLADLGARGVLLGAGG